MAGLLSVTLNNNRVQLAAFDRFVAPELSKYGISLEFEGFDYEFPNHLNFKPMFMRYNGERILEIGAVHIQSMSLGKQIVIDQITLDSLHVYPSLNSVILSNLLSEFNTDATDTEPTSFQSSIPVAIGKVSLGRLTTHLDSLDQGFALVVNDLKLREELSFSQAELQVKSEYADGVLLVQEAHISSTENLRANARLEVDRMFSMESSVRVDSRTLDVKYELDANSSLFEELSSENMADWKWLASNVHIDGTLKGSVDSLELANHFLSPWYSGSIVATYMTSIDRGGVSFKLKPSARLFENEPLDQWPILDEFNVREMDFSCDYQAGEFGELRCKVLSDAGVIRLNTESLSSPLFGIIEFTELPELPVTTLTGNFKLEPSFNQIVKGADYHANATIRSISRNGLTIEGLTMAYWHSLKDSIWLSSLDTACDAEAHVVIGPSEYKGNVLINNIFLPLIDSSLAYSNLQTEFHFNFSEQEGEVVANHTYLHFPTQSFWFNSVEYTHELGRKSVYNLNSDLGTIEVKGNWKEEELPNLGGMILDQISGDTTDAYWGVSSFQWSIDLNQLDVIEPLLKSHDFSVKSVVCNGLYNGPKKRWSLNLQSPYLATPWFELNNLYVNGIQSNEYEDIKLTFNSASIEGVDIDTLSIWTNGLVQDRVFDGYIILPDSIPYTIDFQGKYAQERAELKQFEMNVGASKFELESPSKILWSSDEIKVSPLSFSGPEGRITLFGKVPLFSAKKGQLNLQVTGLHSAPLNYLIRQPDLRLGGQVDAQAILTYSSLGSIVRGSISYRDFTLNEELLGNLLINGSFDNAESEFTGDISLNNHGLNALKANAYYRAHDDSLRLDGRIRSFSIAPFNDFLGGVLDDLTGNISGRLTAQGSSKDWELDGNLNVNDVVFRIPTIGSTFKIDKGILSCNERAFLLDTTTINNIVDSSEAIIWGGLLHNRFDNLALNIGMNTDSLLGVHMVRDVDQYFYGDAVARGTMLLSGPLEQLNLSLNVKTLEGTDFKIPLDNPTSVEAASFLKFVGANERESYTDTTSVNDQIREYFTTDIQIQATDNARLELVLDEVLGDIISAYGSGNMRMKILEDESLELYGLYTVSKGDYLFTLQNIINKPFELIPGGTILWSGDLYEAELDLRAKYSLRSELGDFITNPSYNGDKVDVDLIIHLTGPLMTPEIGFEIELPSSPSSYQEELNRHFLGADQINYQAFSLLMLGSFYQQNMGVQEQFNLQGSVSNTTSEVLVSQFGNWLAAGLGDYVDVELDYTRGVNPLDNFGTTYGDQINLGVGKDFFNGRLRINSSLDVPVGQGQSSSLLLGDTEMIYKVRKDGTIVIKAFNRSNRFDPLMQSSGPYTQGVGIQFKKDFENWPGQTSETKIDTLQSDQ